MFLNKEDINKLIEENKLFIRPLIDPVLQINEVSVDFRLGGDFLVAIQGREPFINSNPFIYDRGEGNPYNSYQETRRKVGEGFLLHPNQTVLASSLEYFKLPNNVMSIITPRSTFARLGLSISTYIQPGYCGCFPLELINNNKTSILLTVGARIFQVKFIKLNKDFNYFSKKRKYFCQVRPILPNVYDDSELPILEKYFKKHSDY